MKNKLQLLLLFFIFIFSSLIFSSKKITLSNCQNDSLRIILSFVGDYEEVFQMRIVCKKLFKKIYNLKAQEKFHLEKCFENEESFNSLLKNEINLFYDIFQRKKILNENVTIFIDTNTTDFFQNLIVLPKPRNNSVLFRQIFSIVKDGFTHKIYIFKNGEAYILKPGNTEELQKRKRKTTGKKEESPTPVLVSCDIEGATLGCDSIYLETFGRKKNYQISFHTFESKSRDICSHRIILFLKNYTSYVLMSPIINTVRRRPGVRVTFWCFEKNDYTDVYDVSHSLIFEGFPSYCPFYNLPERLQNLQSFKYSEVEIIKILKELRVIQI